VVDLSYTKKLQNLSNDYYNQLISRGDYVTQRKEILDMLDNVYNNAGKTDDGGSNPSESFFMNTISFFRNNEKEK